MIRALFILLLATPATAQIHALTDSTYAVPKALLVDYRHITTNTLPSFQDAVNDYEFVVYQDSVIIAQQKAQMDRMGRQLQDMQSMANGYEREIVRRKQIESIYAGEVKRLKWWRRGVIAASVGAVLLLIR